MNRYKYSAFVHKGEHLAWENDLPALARDHSINGGLDIVEILMLATSGRSQGNTATAIGSNVFKIWHKWERRDNKDVLLIRIKLLEDGESVDEKQATSSKRA